MEDIIKIGMADLKASRHPSMLTTLGLGSCVGIALYDPLTKVAGLAHIMLPSSAQARNNLNAAKFADTAIDQLLEVYQKFGAVKGHIIAKIAGGAKMFKFSPSSDMMRIGIRNVVAVKKKLDSLNIKIVSEDTGEITGVPLNFTQAMDGLLLKH